MKKNIIKKKYSSGDIFQIALFLAATCFQLFLLIKNTNIVSSYIESPIIFKIILFILSLPFLFVPIFIISATVVHMINNVYEFFFNRKINVNKAIEKYLREGEEKILKKHKIKLHIKILNYFKHLYNNTIIIDGIILLIIMAVIALISEVWLWKL